VEYGEKNVHPDDERRSTFYNKVIGLMPDRNVVTLHVDKVGLYVFNNDDYKGDEVLFTLPKDYMISGCEFYPFRELFTEYILDFCKNNPLLDKEKIIKTFTLSFYLTYIRLSDKKKAKIYYKKYMIFMICHLKYLNLFRRKLKQLTMQI
jgi:hypothetical protein